MLVKHYVFLKYGVSEFSRVLLAAEWSSRQETYLEDLHAQIFTLENGILTIIALTMGLLSLRTIAIISVRNSL